MTDIPTAYDGLLVRAGLYLLVFWPTVGYYVYDRSRKRGLSRPKARGVVYGFFGVLGLVVFMIQDSDERNR